MSSRKRSTKYFAQSDAEVWPEDHIRTSRPKAKKDTKRWCRGKVGVEHVGAITNEFGYHHVCRVAEGWRKQLWGKDWVCYHEERCTSCGKVLRPWLKPGECPDEPKVESA